MKRFHFPLDRILRFRQLQAEAEQARLEGALAKLREVDDGIGLLQREGARTEAQVRASFAPTAEVRPGDLVSYPDYRFLLARNRQGLDHQRRQAVAAVERQRAAVVEARRAAEVLLRARADVRARWQAAFAKELEESAGELFLAKWKRGR